MSLEFIWFFVFVILVTGYAILDGFDLGVGMLHLFSRDDQERRLLLNSIGPVWDGNEVWLVTAAGALFAGFPPIYAVICSAFYEPVMLFLTALIFRAVAIEFRSKRPGLKWRLSFDILFSLGSALIAFILGFILGNLIQGLPIDAQGECVGSCIDFFNPYGILTGVLMITLFMMHGSIYLVMKTSGELHDHMRSKINPAIIAFIMVYAITTVATLIYMPHMVQAIRQAPWIFSVAVLNMFTIANIPREIHLGNDMRAFLCSCLNIICLMALYAIGTYPTVVRSLISPENSLTIYNSASSQGTLKILLLIAIIGVPLVLAYTIAIYYIFRGKVKLDSSSY